jgi:hypothetical protein
MEYLRGEPAGDGQENDDARFMSYAEIEAREDVVYLVKYLARPMRDGLVTPLSLVDDYEYRLPGSTPDSWKLFM